MNTEVVATLTIKDAGDMTPEGRREIARWLRRQANFLRDHGAEYAPRYRGRYHIARRP